MSAVRGAVYVNAVAGEFTTSPIPPTCPRSVHDALKASECWWDLPFVGVQRFDGGALELRNCADCGSTLAVDREETATTGEQCLMCLRPVDECRCPGSRRR